MGLVEDHEFLAYAAGFQGAQLQSEGAVDDRSSLRTRRVSFVNESQSAIASARIVARPVVPVTEPGSAGDLARC